MQISVLNFRVLTPFKSKAKKTYILIARFCDFISNIFAMFQDIVNQKTAY